MTLGTARLVSLFELSLEDVPEAIYTHSSILGFGQLDLSDLSDEKIKIKTILVPIIDGKRRLAEAFSLPTDISNLCFLSSRMEIKNGALSGRQVKQQYAIKVLFPEHGKPNLIRANELPLKYGWAPEHFKIQFSEFLNSFYCCLDATRLDTGESCKIYVTCAEILRFYYPHNRLVQAAFSGAKSEIVLFNPEIETSKGDRPFVQLRKRIPDICAPHVARIRHSSYAKKTFERIFTDSIYGHSIQEAEGQFLQVYPPINKPCNWLIEAEGISENSDLLVSGIKQCDAVFPFDELLFGRDNDGRSIEDRPKPKKKIYYPIKKGVIESPDGTLPLSVDGMAEINIETMSIIFDFEEDTPNFGALDDLSVKKIEKVSIKDPDTMRIRILVEEEAVNAIVSSGYIRHEEKDKFVEAEISTASVKKSKSDKTELNLSYFDAFLEFQEAVLSLADEFDITWKNITFWGRKNESFYLNAFTQKEIENIGNSWLYLNKREFNDSESQDEQLLHIRKFVVAELIADEKNLYLVDFEKKKGANNTSDSSSILCIHDVMFSKMERGELLAAVMNYVTKKSKWQGRFGHIQRVAIKHMPELSDHLRKRINGIMSAALTN